MENLILKESKEMRLDLYKLGENGFCYLKRCRFKWLDLDIFIEISHNFGLDLKKLFNNFTMIFIFFFKI